MSLTCLVSFCCSLELEFTNALSETKTVELNLDPSAQGVAPALILKGLMPCAPTKPTVAITMRVLETYRVTKVRCPQLAIQSWVKALCDIHGVGFYCLLLLRLIF